MPFFRVIDVARCYDVIVVGTCSCSAWLRHRSRDSRSNYRDRAKLIGTKGLDAHSDYTYTLSCSLQVQFGISNMELGFVGVGYLGAISCIATELVSGK